MIGRSGGKKNLRHTDGVRRGNVRSMMNVRDFNFADDGKRSDGWKER